MRLKEGESVMHYLVRLQILPKFCEYVLTCPNEPNSDWWVNYSSNMVVKLASMEHQSKILAEAVTLAMLQQKFDRLVSLEMTNQLIPHFCNTMSQCPMCRGRTASSSPGKLRPHQLHNTPNFAEGMENIRIPADWWIVRIEQWPR